MQALLDTPVTVWDRSKVVKTWPTHYWRGGDLRPTNRCRYKVGSLVQLRQGGAGVLTVKQLWVWQFRSNPPEVIYVLSNGVHASDWQVF